MPQEIGRNWINWFYKVRSNEKAVYNKYIYFSIRSKSLSSCKSLQFIRVSDGNAHYCSDINGIIYSKDRIPNCFHVEAFSNSDCI